MGPYTALETGLANALTTLIGVGFGVWVKSRRDVSKELCGKMMEALKTEMTNRVDSLEEHGSEGRVHVDFCSKMREDCKESWHIVFNGVEARLKRIEEKLDRLNGSG